MKQELGFVYQNGQLISITKIEWLTLIGSIKAVTGYEC